MSTTPTAADHVAAKRAADLAQLDAAPWQLEHLAAAIAEARAEGRVEALNSGVTTDTAAAFVAGRRYGMNSAADRLELWASTLRAAERVEL